MLLSIRAVDSQVSCRVAIAARMTVYLPSIASLPSFNRMYSVTKGKILHFFFFYWSFIQLSILVFPARSKQKAHLSNSDPTNKYFSLRKQIYYEASSKNSIFIRRLSDGLSKKNKNAKNLNLFSFF